jgi:pimeloyl-ACP methyl ester carboxylesterase
MFTLPDQYIVINDLRVRYWDAGDGPTVLLLHGGSLHIEYWCLTIPALMPNYRVVALDYLGHGRTDKPKNFDCDLDNFAGFVKDFLVAKQISNCHLVGHSMGGSIAIKMAVLFPKYVDHLVLVDAGFLGKEIALPIRLLGAPLVGRILNNFIFPADFASFKKRNSSPSPMIKDDDLQIFWEIGRLPNTGKFFSRVCRNHTSLWGVKKSVYLPLLDDLSRIQNPTLVVWGKQDDTVPYRHALEASRRLSNSRLELIDNCKHGPQLEQPDQFNRILLEFLRKDSNK